MGNWYRPGGGESFPSEFSSAGLAPIPKEIDLDTKLEGAAIYSAVRSLRGALNRKAFGKEHCRVVRPGAGRREVPERERTDWAI